MADIELAQMFADMAMAIEAQPSVEEALDEVVKLALEAVGNTDMAGVSWLKPGGKMETPVFTDPLVSRCDSIQYELGEGPCLEASVEGGISLIKDTRSDTQWPRFAQAAATLGVVSVLACQLSSPRKVLGSLNLYSRTAAAFDDDDKELALIYAAHASIVLANRTLESDLRTAVDTRGTIGQAMGILIERHKVTPHQAFEMLVKASQNRHMKLRDLAAFVVHTGVDPAAV
jgi:GAF domain-containing protein